MRATVLSCALLAACVSFLIAQTPASPKPADRPRPAPVGTMSQIMTDVIYPTSNDLFYVYREPPTNDVEWNKIKESALTMAEFGNLLMGNERAYDDEMWLEDAKLLVDVGKKAYKAASEKNLQAIVDLNQELNDACVQCHMDYRQRYGRRPIGNQNKGKQ
jgi:hypothetical protein